MKILALDTSMESLAIGIYIDGKKAIDVSTPDPKSHNKLLLEKIENILEQNALTLNDIDAFGVVIGPGSFTGIRIGVATVNAMAMATKKPIIELTSLEQLADGTRKAVLLDCKHGNFYAGFFGDKEPLYEVVKQTSPLLDDYPVVYLEKVEPEICLEKIAEKFSAGCFSKTAKPFYIKKSSAETGE